MPRMSYSPENTFDYDDVMLVPRKCVVSSRSQVNVSARLGSHTFAAPVVPANMSTIVDEDTCVYLAENNIFYVMHRFDVDAVEFTQRMRERGLLASVSFGIKPVDFDVLARFVAEGIAPDFITVDVAHGDSEAVFRIVRAIRTSLPGTYVIAGNVASVEGAFRLAEAGAHAVKVGVGPGCFAAGTRVLMADSTYKNIEAIKVGDRVINMEGKPVTVVGTRNSGLRMVQEYKHTNWYKPSYATADHKHFGVDFGGLRDSAIKDEGYAKIADKNKKVAGFPSRKQWIELDDSNLGALLFPRNVDFELSETFTVDLKDFSQHPSYLEGMTTELTPSYDLGYVFGTFLGDGSASIPKKKKENGKVSWVFGLNETHIADKLDEAIFSLTGRRLKRPKTKEGNVILLELNSTAWARFLHSFGKFDGKHLPSQLLVSDKTYLQGLYDGLIDSDGHVENQGLGRTNFTNTSSRLIELVSLLTLHLKGVIPNQDRHNEQNPAGGLKGIVNVDNIKPSYRTRLNTAYSRRLAKEYYAVKITSKPTDYAVVDTYDIEVDCPTHSFIANNVIVHNSACLTAPNTGFGSKGWQLSAIWRVATALKNSDYFKVQVVADGGIRHYGDIAKSIAFGADMVMIGGMFAGHDENPGEVVEIDGEMKKAFFGSASEHQKGEHKHVEGQKLYVPYKGSLSNTLRIIRENLQSSVSYAGGDTLEALHDVEYVRVTR